MTIEQISGIINNQVLPSFLGKTLGTDYTVSPHLDNLIDLGTAIASATADQLKEPMGKFIAGVQKFIVDARGYSADDLGIYKDSKEYDGIVESAKISLPVSMDTNIYTLTNATVYNRDNTYYGNDLNVKVFTKTITEDVIRSVPVSMFKESFASADGVQKLVTLITVATERKLALDNSALEHNLIADLGLNGVAVNLVTAYNTELSNIATSDGMGWATEGDETTGETETEIDTSSTGYFGKPTTVTSANCLYNKHFIKWAKIKIKSIIENSRFMNKKYNDGTIETWLNVADTKCIFNTEAYSLLGGIDGVNVKTTPFWNKQSTSVIPSLSDCTTIYYNDGTGSYISPDTEVAHNKTKSNVIGMVFDGRSVGYTSLQRPVRTSYNADGDFFNHYFTTTRKYFIDTRDTAIIFTLN